VTTKKERPVLICTEYKGVFFGYAKDTSGDTVFLRRARCCIFWPKELGGFVGLAQQGPNKDTKVGPEADMELRKVTCVVEVTPDAERAWVAAPCKF
jgi:hypothetical protein